MTSSIQRTKELIALHVAELNRTGDQLAAWLAGTSPLMSMLHRASDPQGADEADEYSRKARAIEHEAALADMPKAPVRRGSHQAAYYSRMLETNVYATFEANIIDDDHVLSVEVIELYTSASPFVVTPTGWQCWGAGFLTEQTCDAIEIELAVEYQRQIDDHNSGNINDF